MNAQWWKIHGTGPTLFSTPSGMTCISSSRSPMNIKVCFEASTFVSTKMKKKCIELILKKKNQKYDFLNV